MKESEGVEEELGSNNIQTKDAKQSLRHTVQGQSLDFWSRVLPPSGASTYIKPRREVGLKARADCYHPIQEGRESWESVKVMNAYFLLILALSKTPRCCKKENP